MRTLRIGDRELVLVPNAQLEEWSHERAVSWLTAIAEHWVGREHLLKLSDSTLGPDTDVDDAILHLARLIASGELVIVCDDNREVTSSTRTDDGRWDAPRLTDLRRTRPSARDDDDPRRTSPRPTNQNPTDTWTTFVAYAVFDQHGVPLHGSSRCTVDGTPQEHALTGETIDVQPIAVHARVDLELTDLASDTEASP